MNLVTTQRGQAMTEFIIYGLFIFIPVFLLLPYLAKYAEFSQKTEEASRYVSWERTIWSDENTGPWNERESHKSDAEIQGDIRTRIYGHPLQGINGITGVNPFWKNKEGFNMVHNVDVTKLDEAVAPVRMSPFGNVEEVAFSGQKLYKLLDTLLIGSLGRNGLGLAPNNYITSEINVNVENIFSTDFGNIPFNFGDPEMTISSKGAIFSNTWSATYPRLYKRRVDELVPNEILKTVELPARLLCRIKIPGFGDMLFGEACKANPLDAQIHWDELPSNRVP